MGLKELLASCAGLGVGLSSSASAQDAPLRVETGVDAYAYELTDGTLSGHQVVVPLSIARAGPALDFGARAALISNEVSSDFPSEEGSATHFSDVAVNIGWNALKQEMFGRELTLRWNLDVNVPTGHETLSTEDVLSIGPQPLTRYDRFGEGWNVGSGVGVTYQIVDGLIGGANAAVIWRGAYEPGSPSPDTELDPGDQFIFSANLLYANERLMATGSVRYAYENVTTVDGEDFFDRGDAWLFSGAVGVKITERLGVDASAYYDMRGTDQRQDISGNLVDDPRKANGDAAFVEVGVSYAFSENTDVRVFGNWLRQDANEFNEIDFQYLPERERFSLGVSATFRAGDREITPRFEYYSMQDGDILGIAGPEFEGVRLSLSTAFSL